MLKAIGALILLPVFLALQAVWLGPIIIILVAYNISLLAREVRDAKQHHRQSHPFRKWKRTMVDDEDWLVLCFMLLLPVWIWIAYAFPKLELFE